MTSKTNPLFTDKETKKAKDQFIKQMDVTNDLIIELVGIVSGNKGNGIRKNRHAVKDKLAWARVLVTLFNSASKQHEIILGHRRIIEQNITHEETK